MGTHNFLCAFSIRRRIFRTSNWQIQQLVGTLSFLCGFSLPHPQVFFGDQSGKSSSCWAPSTFSVLFHGPPSLFWKSRWQIQEFVGTHSFLCAFSLAHQMFFGNQSGKSRSSSAPLTFSVLFHRPSSFFWKSNWRIE